MFIELNRFMTAADVKQLYQIPDAVFQKVHPHLPVATYAGDGTPYYLESHLDHFFDQWFQQLEAPGGAEGNSEAREAVASVQAEEQLPDQAIPPDQVRIDRQVFGPLTPQQWRLMEIVLAQGSVGIQEAVRHVYGGRFADKEEALRQHKKRINNLLLDEGCQKQIDFSNGYFVLR